MKLVVITSRFPWPLEKGDKLRIYHQLQFLAQHHEIFLISIVDAAPTTTDLKQIHRHCSRVEYFEMNRSQRMLNALLAWMNGKPAQVGYFYSPGVKQKIYQQIVDFQPDRIYCQLLRVSEYVKTLPYVKILDYMDTFSSGMARQAAVRSFPMNLFYKREAKLTQAYERSVYSYFDETTIISERDRNELPILSKNLVKVIPNGIDSEYFSPADTKKEYDLVFVGNLGYKPNEQAVLKLLDWCRTGGLSGKVSVCIAGARPTSKLLTIEEPGWHVAGWFDDIRDAYRNAKIFVAPLTTGSGLQNKLLEAMSCELPCITTSLVNDSIGAQVPDELLVADNADEFAAHVNALLDSQERRISVGKNARNFVLNNYQWSEFNSTLENIITHAKSRSQN